MAQTPKRKRKKTLKLSENAGLEEHIVDRYARMGLEMLSDEIPKKLDPTLISELKPVIGKDISDVRIHTGERAQRMAESLHARAFAAGEKDIFFAKGEFEPSTVHGKAILAHELTHLVEGKVGLMRKRHRPEVEASEMGARQAEERVFAIEREEKPQREDELQEEAKVDVEELQKEEQKADTPSVITIDKIELEERTYQILERLIQKERERSGLV